MHSPSSFSRRVGRIFAFLLGLFGVFFVVDSLGVFITLAIVSVTGGQLSPYSGILLFLVVPLGILIGCAMCWMSYLWLSAPGRAEDVLRAGHI